MWIAWLGHACVVAAAACALAATWLFYDGDRRADPVRLRWARWALGAMVVLVAGAVGCLESALVGDDFHLSYVVDHASWQTPLLYRVGALWGGERGSLLFWTFVLALYGGYVLVRPPREAEHLHAPALAVLAAVSAFFCLMVAGPSSPFGVLASAPSDGLGLNRLLRADSFLLHPVALYLGYVGFTVPFAFAMAGLWHGDTGDRWIRVTHRWALAAWTLLSVGILMGANWSYHVLGWGGYWSFDPVENAALLPWLTATAFVHSAMVQERRGILKAWNVGLVAATYLLTVFGTFLTRSGLADSVHTFAASSLGGWFLAYLGLATGFVVYMVASRWDLLADERSLDALVSKEGAFLLNNVVFVALALTVLVGTLVPLVSAFLGQPVSVGEPYFDRVTAPLFTALLLLAGVGPLLAWRRAGWAEVRRHLLVPAGAATAFAAVLAAAGVRPVAADVGLSSAFFAAAAVLYDFGGAVAARMQMVPSDPVTAGYQLVVRNPRRYGGYLVHLAMAAIAFGVVASHAFQRQGEFALGVGQTATVGGYGFTYEGLGVETRQGMATTYARVAVARAGRLVAVLTPGQSLGADAATAAGVTYDVAIRRSLGEDLYVVLDGYARGGRLAALQVFVNPLVSWIWLGGALLVAGSLFSLWPRAEALRHPRSQRVFALWSELEYDFRMGKIPPEEYRVLRAAYARAASEALRTEGGLPEVAAAADAPAALAQRQVGVR